MDLPGRFGTIALLRQNTPDDVVTSFGVDTPAVSFGRDPNCSVRLYYPDVAPIHARIVFHDKKAFLEVLGEQGLIVDGCQVFPTKTIALGNGSELHIHGKRFRFTYPPKDMRAALAASPARPANRALRLSMIASAQVFSPRPSPNPRENLRVLQSPMRAPPRTRTPSPSPTKSHTPPEPETITLVQGSSPRVVEDEKDLVILEDVEVTPAPQAQLIIAAPPKTPRRQSLHRAVLIRSAHRAVLAATAAPTPNSNSSGGSGPTTPAMNTGPAKESSSSRSVSPNKGKFSVPADDTDTDTDTEEEEEEVRALGLEVVSVSSGSDSEGDEDEEDAQEEEPQQRIGWRKSLERLWPFGRVKTEVRLLSFSFSYI
ncbi:hypothetical protein C8F01DRAFT_501654 [Mycena amicta]|nr:hypothetical protein C8F01DRAFT_501654 [Mycena amicta]